MATVSLMLRQIEVYTTEPVVPGPVVLRLKLLLQSWKSISRQELIQAGGEILLSAIHKLINSVWNTEEFPD
jgi:hypothetical protein